MIDADADTLIQRHRSLIVLVAAALPLAVCAVLATVRASVTNTTGTLVLVLIVVAAASTGVRIAGFVAALSSGLWFDVFLTQPYGQLTIHDRNDVEATILLVVIGAAVTEVALWGHRQQAQASRRSGYLDGVLGTAEIITLRHDTPEILIAHVASQITEVLGIDDCRYVAGSLTDPRIPVLDHQGLVHRNGRAVKVDQNGLPTDDEIALPVRRGDKTLGHFLLTAASRIAHPSIEQRRVAVLLADQAGSVIETHTG